MSITDDNKAFQQSSREIRFVRVCGDGRLVIKQPIYRVFKCPVGGCCLLTM